MVHAICQLTSYIKTKLDAKLPTVAAFIDFRMGFDCVQHPVLIQKLRNTGLNETVLDWVQSYLSNNAKGLCTDIERELIANSRLGCLCLGAHGSDPTRPPSFRLSEYSTKNVNNVVEQRDHGWCTLCYCWLFNF